MELRDRLTEVIGAAKAATGPATEAQPA
jgi:hypothetical protein